MGSKMTVKEKRAIIHENMSAVRLIIGFTCDRVTNRSLSEYLGLSIMELKELLTEKIQKLTEDDIEVFYQAAFSRNRDLYTLMTASGMRDGKVDIFQFQCELRNQINSRFGSTPTEKSDGTKTRGCTKVTGNCLREAKDTIIILDASDNTTSRRELAGELNTLPAATLLARRPLKRKESDAIVPKANKRPRKTKNVQVHLVSEEAEDIPGDGDCIGHCLRALGGQTEQDTATWRAWLKQEYLRANPHGSPVDLVDKAYEIDGVAYLTDIAMETWARAIGSFLVVVSDTDGSINCFHPDGRRFTQRCVSPVHIRTVCKAVGVTTFIHLSSGEGGHARLMKLKEKGG